MPAGDITTEALIPRRARVSASIIAEEDCVVCGLAVLPGLFLQLDASCTITLLLRDGDRAKKGAVIATVSGNARALLQGERVFLNLLQRLSGTATLTAAFVKAVR